MTPTRSFRARARARVAGLLLASLAAPASTLATPSEEAKPDSAAVDVAAASFWSRFTPRLDLRGRMEFADQDGKDEAASWTLRGRLGLLAQIREDVSAFGELEHTRAANRQRYQAASVHGLGDNKVVIADPESFELNQLWLAYSGDALDAKAGIQRVIVENARFIGNVGWRQNEQTFDGVTLGFKGIEHVELRYGYLYNVRRIFGSEQRRAAEHDDFDSRSHFVTAAYTSTPALRLAAYAYFLDLENAAGSSQSNNTVGASLTGTLDTSAAALRYRLELATQTDAGDSRLDYDADYLHVQGNAKFAALDVGVGYEILGAGDGVGFNTPLATLHTFNGFADTFLATPGIGLRDLYASVGTSLPFGIQAKAIYHDFTAEDDSTDLGYEVDLVLSRPLSWGIHGTFKVALYNADEGGYLDTQRFVLQLDYVP